MKFTDKVINARDLITEALSKYENVAVACSFGKDSMVVLHITLQINPGVQVFSVMTPFKFKETFEYKDMIHDMWCLNMRTYIQSRPLGYSSASGRGYLGYPEIYKEDPDKCCDVYKVDMTKQAIRELNLDAWITGLRRTEGRTRTNYDFIETDKGLVKVNPILDFTELDVWRYLAVNEIPVNPLYKEGYRSLGCEPCSRKEVDENETEREGRWHGTSKCGGECGIHTQVLK